MIFVSQDLPNWHKQCNAHRLLDPQVRKPPVTKWQNVKKSKTPFGDFIVAGYTGERKNQWKSDKMWRKSLKHIWCFHCCSQERLLPLRPNSRRVLLQIGGPKQVTWSQLGALPITLLIITKLLIIIITVLTMIKILIKTLGWAWSMIMMLIKYEVVLMVIPLRWCSEGEAKEEVGPVKQAVLCQGRTAHQVIIIPWW